MTDRPVVLVIGIGNIDRGDDGVGIIAARHLRERLEEGAMVRECRGVATELIEAWHGAGAVILIDAISSADPPGTISRIDLASGELPPTGAGSSTHGMGLAQAVELARALDRLPGSLTLYGIAAGQFQLGSRLSPAVSRAVAGVVERVLTEIDRIRTRCTPAVGERRLRSPESGL